MSSYRPTRREVMWHGAGLAALAGVSAAAQGRAEPAYPDDAFSRPQDDRLIAFETLEGVGQFMDVRQRSAEFPVNELRVLTDARDPHTVWRFRSKQLAHNALFIQQKVRHVPVAISFAVVNPTDQTLAFSMQAHEMAWLPVSQNTAAVWALGEPRSVGPGQAATVRFEFANARADGRSAMRLPIVAFVILAQGFKPGTDVTLELRALTVHYPPARFPATALSASVGDARSAAFSIRVDGDPPAELADQTVDIEVRRDEWVMWRVRLTDDELRALGSRACRVARDLPPYLAAGQYAAGLVVDGYRVRDPDTHLTAPSNPRAARRRGTPPFARAERRLRNGRPSLFVNGKPTVWSGYSSYDYQPGNVGEFARSGANVLCVPTCAGRHIHHVSAPTWIAPDRWDFGELDERVAFSLQASPDAFIFLRVSLTLPPFWLQDRLAELARVRTEAGAIVWEEGNGTQAASLASEEWLRDQEAALRRLIRHCSEQPWAERLIGFWPTCEVTEEWFAWGCNDGQYGDYSAPNEKRFAAWARARGLSLAPGGVPLPDARKKPGFDVYPQDERGRAAVAYHAYLSDMTAETIGRYAGIVKDATAGRSLVGCFYGYVIQLAGEPRQAISGHFGLRRILDDKRIDIVAGVPLLDFRDLTNGYNPYCSATDSIAGAGKLYCNENDMFSWLHPILWHTDYDPKDPRGGAISMHRRECAGDSVRGAMAQKFGLASSWHHDAELHRDFAVQKAIYSRAAQCDRTPVSEIAFIVDDTGLAWTPPESTLLAAAHKRLLRDLGRTGAPVGVWLLSDLDRLPRRTRLVVVASATAARRDDIARLAALIERGGRTVLVVGAPGLVDPANGTWDTDAPARILGLPVRVADEALPGKTFVGDVVVSTLGPVRPRASVERVAGMRYEDGPGAYATRALAQGGRLIWCGVPPTDTLLLARWVADSRVHAFAPPGCFVHASRELVAITSPWDRDMQLRWPKGVTATDEFDGWRGAGALMSCPFKAGQTRLFRVTPLLA